MERPYFRGGCQLFSETELKGLDLGDLVYIIACLAEYIKTRATYKSYYHPLLSEYIVEAMRNLVRLCDELKLRLYPATAQEIRTYLDLAH